MVPGLGKGNLWRLIGGAVNPLRRFHSSKTNEESQETAMNKFQAMALIMAILCEDGRFPKGSHRYQLARKLVATKIDTIGPNAAYAQAKWSKHTLSVEIEGLQKAEKAGKIISNFI